MDTGYQILCVADGFAQGGIETFRVRIQTTLVETVGEPFFTEIVHF